MRRLEVLAAILVVASFALSLYFYPSMPGLMASHWNINGEVDGYMPKFWGLFMFPMISLFLFLLFKFIPIIDPYKANIKKFIEHFDRFVLFFLIFFLYIQALVIAWNSGLRFSVGQAVIPAISILFFYIGVILGKTKRNWFIGIRTPWTLSSDEVWERVHKRGSLLFKVCALFTLLGAFFGKYGFLFLLVPLGLTVIYLYVYSYIEYKRGKGGK
jgi:uncharacterized membrane protein